MTKLAFLDTETTGLDPRHHEIWEVGIIIRDLNPLYGDPQDIAYAWQLRPDLDKANPKALEIGRYHERFSVRTDNMAATIDVEDGKPWTGYGSRSEAFIDIQQVLDGAHIVGAVPSFDDAFLKASFWPLSLRVTWHYHLIDVETLAVGWLEGDAAAARAEVDDSITSGVTLPWNSEDLSARLGVDAAAFDRHTALGDARWALAIYDAVMGAR